MDYLISDYGAVADGKHNNSIAIQKAIDACTITGGRVVISKGYYKTSSIVLKSHVDLHLEEGAILEGVDDIHAYQTFSELASKSLDLDETPTWENCEYTGRPSQFFIYAKDASYITISGKGIIDGNEKIFYGKRHEGFIEGSYYPRIPLIFFEHIDHLVMKDVTIQKSGFWTTHLVGCEYVVIDSIKILNNMALANNDGIDPDHCKHMEIKNCYIEAADDAIVFKNTEGAKNYGACEDIHVHDCELVTTSSGIKFGTESVSDFNNININHIKIRHASRGISFQLRDEGHINHITCEHIDIQSERHTPGLWWGTGEPIFISAVKRHEEGIVGSINHLSFKHIHMIGENGIVIYGEREDQLHHIRFDHCQLQIKAISPYPKEGLDLRPTVKPDILKDDAHVVKMHYASNVIFKHFQYDIDDTLVNDVKPYDIQFSKHFEIN